MPKEVWVEQTVPNDAELIEQVLAGQCQQYAVLVRRYERIVHATAMRYVRDAHRADDVAQESFVAAFQSLSSLRDRSHFLGWLLGIVRRKAARAHAHDVRCQSHPDVSTQECPQPSDGRTSDDSLALLELVERLPEQERVVIGLRHFDGHSVREISEFTGRPVGTVTKQLSRAHARLHAWITEETSHERRETSRQST